MRSVSSGNKLFGYRWGAGLLGMAALALGAAVLTPIALAEDPGPEANVARLSYVDGNVQIAANGQVMADQAPVNAPLPEGATVTTAQDGQAEIQFEDGSIARIAPNSSLTLASLPGSSGQGDIVLNGGLGYFELQSGSLAVHFGDSTATVAGMTVLRIEMDQPPGSLAVLSGNVHLVRGDAMELDLQGGESVALAGNDPSQYDISESIEPNSWDSWNSDRDQALSAESSDQTQATNEYPNSDNPAWNDLNANGNWYDVPDQGYVWSPYEAADSGWDPYGCGSWVWTPGLGYVWASCESWGFLPYETGMWSYYDGFGWGWTPDRGREGRWFDGRPGIHVRRGPDGYRPVERPNPRGSGSHYPHPPIAINRHDFANSEPLPSRDRNRPAQIAGATVMPMQRQGFRQSDHQGSFGSRNQATPEYRNFIDSRRASGMERTPTPAIRNSRPVYTPPATAFRNPGNPGSVIPGHGYTYTQPSHSFTQPFRPYTPPARTDTQPARTYTQPARTYTPPARTYTPPARNYTPPPSYTPPSRPSGGYSGGGGGGGSFHGGGGGGGGGFHGGGGGGAHSGGGHH